MSFLRIGTRDYAFRNWASGATTYVGYEDKDGHWIVQKFVISTGVITYCRGEHDYATNWTNRASLTYSTFSGVF